ncbi:hypothetical protein [Polaromonas sp. JS666]|uniref:hypothetical protein n=1 Tax=Polaromonas sp. (strain JS666 / ATCC BAA-500) TaxID=296591 RepID=UPI0000532FE7|nr:hypothetical protein [Polaromonas sp. JS666]ABE42916.1 phage-related hypothetical protein [Polaromonas sp. JS666]
MPNPGKPDSLKLITGSRRLSKAAPVATLPPVATVPAAPDWLVNAHAVKEWNRLALILVANKLLTEASLSPLAHACCLFGRLAQSWASGIPPTAALQAQYRNLINDFGLTPVSQGKVPPSGPDTPGGNRFSRHGRHTRG